jgi:hypothetical protein
VIRCRLFLYPGFILYRAAREAFSVIDFHDVIGNCDLVTQRTPEIGIRMALGAERKRVLLMLLDGLRPALVGLALGMAASVAITRLIRSVLYGTSSTRRDRIHLGDLNLAACLHCGVSCSRVARGAHRSDARPPV